MSTEQAELPGPHVDRSRDGPPSPARLEERGPDSGLARRAYYEDQILFPGYGEQPDRCMARKPVGFCDESGHTLLASASPCETRKCPEHSSLYRREATVKAVARLAAYRHVQEGAGKRLLHVVDSFDPERHWTAEDFWQERSRSYDVVKDVGGRGGTTFLHPYRTSDEGDWLFEQAVDKGEWEAEWGKWSLLRSTADDWEEMKKFIEPGPHAHHLVAAEDFDPDQIPAGRTVKNIRSLERFHIRDMTGYRDMARLVMYLLSHAAFEPVASAAGREVPGREEPRTAAPSTVTYFGEVHPNSFNPEEELTAAEWQRIQDMARRAVTTRPSDDLPEVGESEVGHLECPHDGCDGRVVPLDELRQWLRRDPWVRSLDRRERRILFGVLAWIEKVGDRPPPTMNAELIREELRQMGKDRERLGMAGLGSFGESSV
jgi:hypothetical protein